MTQTNIPAELQTKFEKEIKEFNFKQGVNASLPGIEILAYLGYKDKFNISARCKNLDEFKTVLSAYPATNKQTIIGTAGNSSFAVLNTPFRVDIDNPARPSNTFPFCYKVSWESGDIEISVSIPIELAPDFSRRIDRGIYDSEYHYFIGQPYSKLKSMRVTAYTFNGSVISWYGGNKTLKSESEIFDFINFINS